MPPELNTSPLPEYGYNRLDYGMTIGIRERTPGGLIVVVLGGWRRFSAGVLRLAPATTMARLVDSRLVVDSHSPGTRPAASSSGICGPTRSDGCG